MSELAAWVALVLAASIAVELGRAVARVRRRVRLNRAMHELRRPIQSVALAIGRGERDLAGAAAWLEQVRGALAQLDAEINVRARPTADPGGVSVEALAQALDRRWRREGVRVAAATGGPRIAVDACRLGAALDNLVANALEHGSGPVFVRAVSASGFARFEVRDGGDRTTENAVRPAQDPRRGHGLAVASAVASSHGGTLAAPRRESDGGTVATLSLPVDAAHRGRGE